MVAHLKFDKSAIAAEVESPKLTPSRTDFPNDFDLSVIVEQARMDACPFPDALPVSMHSAAPPIPTGYKDFNELEEYKLKVDIPMFFLGIRPNPLQ